MAKQSLIHLFSLFLLHQIRFLEVVIMCTNEWMSFLYIPMTLFSIHVAKGSVIHVCWSLLSLHWIRFLEVIAMVVKCVYTNACMFILSPHDRLVLRQGERSEGVTDACASSVGQARHPGGGRLQRGGARVTLGLTPNVSLYTGTPPAASAAAYTAAAARAIQSTSRQVKIC